MSMDFNDAEPQGQGGSEPIPEGTVAPVIAKLRAIKTGKADSRVQGLDVEYTVTAGSYKGRKAWGWHGIKGSDSDGHKQMVSITRSYLRAMLESAYSIDPADASDAARAARTLSDWEDLDGLEFVARFKVEKGTDFTNAQTGELKRGKDKNTIAAVTPDDPEYNGFKGAKPKSRSTAKASNGAARQPATATAGGGRPDWA